MKEAKRFPLAQILYAHEGRTSGTKGEKNNTFSNFIRLRKENKQDEGRKELHFFKFYTPAEGKQARIEAKRITFFQILYACARETSKMRGEKNYTFSNFVRLRKGNKQDEE